MLQNLYLNCRGHSCFQIRRKFSTEPSLNIFNRTTKRYQKDRATLLENSREFDYLRDEVARRLADRLEDILMEEYPIAIDLGGHSGFIAKYLQDSKVKVKTLYQTDFSEKMLTRDISLPHQGNIQPIRLVVDEEYIPFENSSIDLVMSSMSLHWVNDLPGTFAQVRNCLKPNGLFIGALLGGNTLHELRSSFALAEQEREGGISPHISPFAGIGDIGNLLTRAQFALPTVDTEIIQINYSDPFTLMRDLKGMGENNAVIKRRSNVPRDTFMAAASIYQSLYGNPDGSVPATFQIIYFIGWAPHESQPQPKKRGSAQVSLKSLGEKSDRFV